ncbi:MAG: biotin synthase BioB [SAR324 cluster bacterium]|nr:biotin synthase BioB [SAR324 cluster bacterium]
MNAVRMDWSREEISGIFHSPVMDLLHRAHTVYRENFQAGEVQVSSLLSIKTGGCPEDCAYCTQSAHYDTGTPGQSLLSVAEVMRKAAEAKALGATRFCMGAAWRQVRDGDEFDQVLRMVREVSGMGMETCCTLGMLTEEQARRLKSAGLYAYNHNIDTSEAFYGKIISTRTYQDRIRTIEVVRKAGITVCTGVILGMGETDEDRVAFLHQLAMLDPHAESVTVNCLIPAQGTPLQDRPPISPILLVRVIATARILMPHSMVRLSAGRQGLSPESHLLCFYAGANSIFAGERLLTAPNREVSADGAMFEEFDLKVMAGDLARAHPGGAGSPAGRG